MNGKNRSDSFFSFKVENSSFFIYLFSYLSHMFFSLSLSFGCDSQGQSELFNCYMKES